MTYLPNMPRRKMPLKFYITIIAGFIMLTEVSRQWSSQMMDPVKQDESFIQSHLGTLDLKESILATSITNGRLGNIISSYASLYAYKEQFGVVPLFPRSNAWLLCYYFQCRENIMTLEETFPSWESHQWTEFDPNNATSLDSTNSSVPNPNLGHYLDIGEYPHKFNYIHKFLPLMRESFLTFKEPFQEYARSTLLEAKKNFTRLRRLQKNDTITYISIHSRNNDYKKHLSYKNHTFVNQTYFTMAMNIFRQSEKNPLFIVVSQDMDFVKQNVLPMNNDCLFLGTGIQTTSTKPPNVGITDIVASPEIGNDLALLSQVNNSILTYGSYGIWGAFLAGSQKVILPGSHSDLEEMVEIKRANLSNWIFI